MVYDWSEGGDTEQVCEDIENLEMDLIGKLKLDAHSSEIRGLCSKRTYQIFHVSQKVLWKVHIDFFGIILIFM